MHFMAIDGSVYSGLAKLNLSDAEISEEEYCAKNSRYWLKQDGSVYSCNSAMDTSDKEITSEEFNKERPISEEYIKREVSRLQETLAQTDWYATRLAETGKAIPDEIWIQRQAARDRISELKAGVTG